jgi:hypothetical protein
MDDDHEDYVQIGENLVKLQPTAELRWGWQHVPAPHLGEGISQGEKALQQKWVADGGHQQKWCWRNVPTEPYRS